MTKVIEAYLTKYGYTNIRWEWGHKGWYIMASYQGVQMCIDFEQITKEIINAERGYYRYCNIWGKVWKEPTYWTEEG